MSEKEKVWGVNESAPEGLVLPAPVKIPAPPTAAPGAENRAPGEICKACGEALGLHTKADLLYGFLVCPAPAISLPPISLEARDAGKPAPPTERCVGCRGPIGDGKTFWISVPPEGGNSVRRGPLCSLCYREALDLAEAIALAIENVLARRARRYEL